MSYQGEDQVEKTATAAAVFKYYGCYGVSGPTLPDGGASLDAFVSLPENLNALLLAACYDPGGRMTDLKTWRPAPDKAENCPLAFPCRDGYTYKLMVVDAVTFAPLFEPWSQEFGGRK